MNRSKRWTLIKRSSFLVAIGLSVLMFPADSKAQAGAPSKPILSGQPFVVWKMHHDFKTADQPIADFPKLEAARKYANSLNDKLKLSDDFHYSVHERQDDTSGKTPPDTDLPATGKLDLFKGLREKPWIDVGSSGSATKEVTSSATTKGKGLVDKAKVTLVFKPNGTFVIDGEYAATGTWKVLANSIILLDGRDVRFSGLVKGKTIKGKFGRLRADGEVERSSDGSPIIRDWTADLTAELTALPGLENTVWHRQTRHELGGGVRNAFSSHEVMVFLPNGEFVALKGNSELDADPNGSLWATELARKGKWKMNASDNSIELYQMKAQLGKLRGRNPVQNSHDERLLKFDGMLAPAMLDAGKWQPYKPSQSKKLNAKVTADAIGIAKKATWEPE